MPVIILYLFKLSLSLAVVFSFYHFVLRRLTFYNWNRFYLVAYTALSFFIPFINITPVLERNEMMNSPAVQFIPSVNTFTNIDAVAVKPSNAVSLSNWDWMILFFATGIFILVVRMLIQLYSYRRILSNATLISSDGVKVYQVDQSIIPFSFGKSIFINREQHSEQELEEIIRHEFVHIRQKHTIDIIWSEILCILNWYNPFVWLIRKSIRQNLEFIADDKVLQSGIDKKQYQYLLLKVTGNNHLSIASQFNFSSLKKRIAMMNKMKSAGVHLLKFLFVLPLMAVLILSFRGGKRENPDSNDFYIASGIVYDWDTEQPLADVDIADVDNVISVQTDKNGYYSIKLNAKENHGRHFMLNLSRKGYKQSQAGFAVGKSSAQCNINFIGLVNNDSKSRGSNFSDLSTVGKNGKVIVPDYEFLKEKFKKNIQQERLTKKVDKLVENSEKPIWIIEGIPFAISSQGSKAWVTSDEVEQSTEFRVWVDGKIMTMEEANRTIKRSLVRSVGATTIAGAKKLYNLNYSLLMLTLKNGLESEMPDKSDTIPAQSSLNNKNYLVTIEDNNGNGTIVIKDKNKKEVKRLLLTEWNDKKSYYEKLYGQLPADAKNLNDKNADASLSEPSKQYNQNFFERNKQPLVILDGVEQPENTDPSSVIEPSEIAELTVLKNRDAIAIYGYRAKNGVIVLTSKTYMNRTVDETVSTTVFSATNAAPVMATNSNAVTMVEKPVAGKPAEVNSKGFGTLESLQPQVASTSTTTFKSATIAPGKFSAVSAENIRTTAPLKTTISSRTEAPVRSATIASGKPAQTTTTISPVSVTEIKTATESVSAVKEIRTEKNIIAVLKSSTTEAEVKKIENDLKSKGYDFKINKIEFKEGKLVLINGTISKNSKKQYFTASDFAKLIIADVPEDDKDNRFNFMVMSGNLNVSDKVQ